MIGNIDSWGTFDKLNNQGFNIEKAIIELVGNSLDAKATEIIFRITENKIFITDNGIGMDTEGLRDMFNLNRNKSFSFSSFGKCGVGAKGAINTILNKKNKCTIYTKQKDCHEWKVVVDMAKIYKEKRYENNINLEKSDEKVILHHGTVIEFPRETELENVILKNFNIQKDGEFIKLEERLDITYSEISNCKICLILNNETKFLEPLNIFSEDFQDYDMKKSCKISVFSDGKKDIYYGIRDERSFWHYKKDGRGYSKNRSVLNISDKNLITDLEFTLVVERDPEWFNYTGEPVYGVPPLRKFIKTTGDESCKKFYSYCKLNRNGQIIGTFPLESLSSVNTARGGSKQWFENIRVQCQLYFKVHDDSTSILDDIFDTQANKTQYNDSKISKNKGLVRILTEEKEKFANECWTRVYSKRKDMEEEIQTPRQGERKIQEPKSPKMKSPEPKDNVSIQSQKKKEEIFGTIYLIRTREFKNADKNIFKIGKTKNEPNKRLGNYGKGCELICAFAIKNECIDLGERVLIDIFKAKFLQKIEIGTEWFEGDLIEMCSTISEFCLGKLRETK